MTLSRRWIQWAALGASSAVLIAGCGGSTAAGGKTSASTGTSGTKSSSGTVTLAALIPLSGPSASFGTDDDLPGYNTAVAAINAAGGIMGKKLTLVTQDLGADPADAVAATHQLLASHPNLNGIVGLTSDTAMSTAPIVNQAGITTVSTAGTDLMDKVKFNYIWRDGPPDATESIAMAAYAIQKGWKTAAILVGENSGSQSTVPPFVAAFQEHGGKVVINEKLPLDQTSYRVELQKMLAAKPQMIFTETDGQTAATMFSELKQMNNLSIPVLGTDPTIVSSYTNAVSKAVGGFAVEGKFLYSCTAAVSQGAGYATFQKYFTQVNPGKTANVYNAMNYDGVMIEAIAMNMAKSTNPKVYNSFIPKVTNNHSGVEVTTYPQAVAAIKAGKAFYYNGASGPMSFNTYHWVTGPFNVGHLTSSGKWVPTALISAKTVAQYEPAAYKQ